MQHKEEMMQWSCPPELYTTLSINGCGCKNQISTAIELVNLCQYWMNAQMCVGISLKNKETSVE